tara:strand:- start:2293 stop:2712 length:420 start_codon:yes stop_codon:yes gene_type:complete
MKKIIHDFKLALKKERMKFTDQRYMVLKFLFDNKGHFECEDIIERLKRKNKKVSRATVYRTLDILVKYDFARKLVLDDGVARYENKIDSPHHDHMICIDTGDILEFECEEIERLQDEIASAKGYEVIKHVHQLFVKKIK